MAVVKGVVVDNSICVVHEISCFSTFLVIELISFSKIKIWHGRMYTTCHIYYEVGP